MSVTLHLPDLVPHQGPALLVDSVTEVEEHAISCHATISPRMWSADAEGVSTMICLELMAQSVAAYTGYHALRLGKTLERAFLVSCRRLVLERTRLHHGDQVDIHAKVRFVGNGALRAFDCEVICNGERVAHGSLNVYEGDLERAEVSE